MLDVADLPSKVAQVQAELHQLDQDVHQTRQAVRQARLATQENHAAQQLLQQQLQQDLIVKHVLQMRQTDLLILKSTRGQKAGHCEKKAVLQVSSSAKQGGAHYAAMALSCLWFSCRENLKQLGSSLRI